MMGRLSFFILSHIAPHTPLQTTTGYLDRYGHVQDMPTKIYAAMVSALDDSVGAYCRETEGGGSAGKHFDCF